MTNNDTPIPANPCCPTGPCSKGSSRRQFMIAAGGAMGTIAAHPLFAAIDSGQVDNEYLRIIPADKQFDPGWLASLYARGEKQTWSDPQALEHIGMPVGGLFAGTLYLGGDGRLWLWDIFNCDQEGIVPRSVDWQGGQIKTREGANYVSPARPFSPLKQGFTLAIGGKARSLDCEGFRQITFDGRYPIGRVRYRDADCPVEVRLEAFSPFIPLSVADSSLPATVMSFRVKNTGETPVEVELLGHLQNAVCLDSKSRFSGRLSNRIVRAPGLTALVCSALPSASKEEAPRPDILFDDFERPLYETWTAEGDAFGQGPVEKKAIPKYQGDVGGEGERVVNSHASAPGGSVGEKDARVGTLTSRPFTIERRYIQFYVGGGAHEGKTCVNLLVDGKPVASATGRNDNRMARTAFNTRQHEGKQARLQVVDQVGTGWGNIGIDQIVFTDRPPESAALQEQRDFGTMALALLGGDEEDIALADRAAAGESASASAELSAELIGQVGRKLRLAPGEEKTADFAVTWHFPNFYARGAGGGRVGHAYAARFESALAVARYLAANSERLCGDTRAWVETWYDSTLPYWLLDRTLANTSTLATTTCYRFEDGRFWAWEGIGCCQGTCTHVWHYAQAPGRLFPEIERDERERVNFGIGMHESGGIGMRTDVARSNEPADDGQCGRILGAYREHQMSPDSGFLQRIWPKVKLAIEYMIQKDGNGDGIVEGAQPNTLDAAWFGKISFLASLYLAALRAGEAMATEIGDAEFAARCRRLAERGAESILELYNGEYFIQLEDPERKKDIGVGPGCYIDQVFGQTWAHWVGLGRLFDAEKQRSALRALFRYNFLPDVGPFRAAFPRGRWYAAAGDAGLLMCTWPKGGQNPEFKQHWQYMYFNECMTGFEWQAAAHMIWEGIDQPDLLEKGLAVSRAIHDRYSAARRNPYNEIECSDHYARAMASYGVFQAACGFNCHGPKGRIEFAPRLSPENFKAAMTTAEGWGSYSQQSTPADFRAEIEIKHGRLRLKTLVVAPAGAVSAVKADLDGQPLAATVARHDGRAIVTFADAVVVSEGQRLQVRM